jgi:hypothetical protein
MSVRIAERRQLGSRRPHASDNHLAIPRVHARVA